MLPKVIKMFSAWIVYAGGNWLIQSPSLLWRIVFKATQRQPYYLLYIIDAGVVTFVCLTIIIPLCLRLLPWQLMQSR
jgi:hypothetical protein